ncbi:hypothetical protein CLF_100041 [Clonorchis sinensis]|uniref:Uncharacterized protein n=1 Tax=Clonorchis sinensis TaxID=79923 RepID=G7Y2I4_CLOSI|nr:hypothetical protein CLF_100041 [Clonorchis sinensis]
MCTAYQKQEFKIQAVIELAVPPHSSRSGLRNSGDPEAAVAGSTGVVVVSNHHVEGSLLNRVPVDSCLFAVRLAMSMKKSHKQEADCYLFPMSTYAITTTIINGSIISVFKQ